MYLITNRALHTANKKLTGLKVFGKTPNAAGPNELRLLRVTRKADGNWQVAEISDKLAPAKVKALKQEFNLDIDVSKPWPGSLQVACELFKQASATTMMSRMW
jgi:hypothetical protein